MLCLSFLLLCSILFSCFVPFHLPRVLWGEGAKTPLFIRWQGGCCIPSSPLIPPSSYHMSVDVDQAQWKWILGILKCLILHCETKGKSLKTALVCSLFLLIFLRLLTFALLARRELSGQRHGCCQAALVELLVPYVVGYTWGRLACLNIWIFESWCIYCYLRGFFLTWLFVQAKLFPVPLTSV